MLGNDNFKNLILQGGWDANINDPDITGTTTTGFSWVVTAAGTTDLGGINNWAIGDWAIKIDGGWTKLPGADTGGAMILQGPWDADTNDPDITGTTVTGYTWRVSVAGSTDLGGIDSWLVGDLAVKTAAGWLKIENHLFDENPVFNTVTFSTVPITPSSAAGTCFWNALDKTLQIASGDGPIYSTSQTLATIVYNDTASIIKAGSAVYGVALFNTKISADLADAEDHTKIEAGVCITAMDVPIGGYGICMNFGVVTDIDTTTIPGGGFILYVSANTLGGLTTTKPEFPDYAIQVGVISKPSSGPGVFDGELTIEIKGNPRDTIVNFWNGTFRESFDFLVSSDGATITGSLSPSNGHPDMTMMLSDGFTMLDTSPAIDIVLTAGSDAIPQANYVYIPKSTKDLTVSTSDWPSNVEHIKVAQIVLRSAAATKLDGALRNQNWNDHIESTSTFQGHLSHITARMRQNDTKWDSGVEGSVVVGGGGYVAVKNTAGVAYQLHRQDFPILDTTPYTIDAISTGSKTITISDDGDLTGSFPTGRILKISGSTGNDGMYTVASTLFSSPNFIITVEEAIPDATSDGEVVDTIHVVNDSGTAYREVSDLSDITTDASGAALLNTSFSVVVWGVLNKGNQPSHLMANMPLGTFSKNFPEVAVDDATNQAVYAIPKDFQGVGFLIARFTFVDNAGVWSLYDTEDLRGQIPNTSAGGGGGGGGVTSFTGLTDTPSAYTGLATYLMRVNAGETGLESYEWGSEPESIGFPVRVWTPGATYKSRLDLGEMGTLVEVSSGVVVFSSNWYNVATDDKRIKDGYATRMIMNPTTGTMLFQTAITGVADSEILAWVDALLINNDGTLGDITLGDDKVLALGSSATSETSLINLSSNGTKVADVITQTNVVGFRLATTSDYFGIKRSSGGDWAFLIKDNGIITGPSSVPSDITTGAVDGAMFDNFGKIRTSTTSSTATAHNFFYNPNGLVGSIQTNGTATIYATSCDPRLKKFLEMMREERLNSEFIKAREALLFFTFKGDPTKEVLGFDAHKLIDARLSCGGGVEGEGPRDKEIGEVYKTTMEDTEIQQLIVDDNGKAILKDGKEQYETVTVKKKVEHKVTPAGVDQSKLVPLLLLKIDQLEREAGERDTLIRNIMKRLDVNKIYLD